MPCPLPPVAGANQPGEIWVEDSARGGLQQALLSEVNDDLIQRLAEHVARVCRQGINREHPLLGATLPYGSRIQFCGPPATRNHRAMAILRHRLLNLPLKAYAGARVRDLEANAPVSKDDDPTGWLREAIRCRKTIP